MSHFPRLSRFLLPEGTVSVKLIFDNIRNYIICGAFFGLANWFQHGAPNVPAFAVGPRFHEFAADLALFPFVVGALLLLINAFQSLEFFSLTVDAIGRATLVVMSKADTNFRSVPSWLKLLVIVVVLIVFLICLIVAVIIGAVVLSYLLTFQAVEKGAL